MILPDRQTHLAAQVTPATPDFYQAAVGSDSNIPIVPLASLSRRIAVLQRRYQELRDFPTLTDNDEISRIRHELIALLNQRAHILRVARAQ